ncbi:MAG TPA: CBS domain-containing protein [Gemmatales bacterium]|mgnify:CR=1 FL=1|nr:CBS domain-containing protein [Gemmatales bacterium]HMP60203.1 CBS domain-containing protein [Gemmatales bacterium]
MAKNPGSDKPELVLRAQTAADLMSENPVSLARTATLKEASALFLDREIHAAPVIDAAGHPVGVISQTDLVRHSREHVDYAAGQGAYQDRIESRLTEEELGPQGFQVESTDRTTVGEVMTPTVIAVQPKTSAADVVAQMLAFKIHRLFVVDDAGVLVGIISTWDVLRNIRQR